MLHTDEIKQSASKTTYAQVRTALGSLVLGDSLKAKIFRGGAWLGSGNIAEQAARFGRNIILARLLAPESFGAMAVVLSATSVLQSFTDIGVKEGLIQNPKGGSDHYVDAAWWLGLGRTLSLAAVLFVAAPFVAKFYGNLELAILLRFSTIGVVLGGALSPRAYVAVKEMKFGKFAAINNIGGIFGVIVTVSLSFLLRDVWALMIGYCADAVGRCVLSYFICPYVPSFRWDGEAVRDLLRFSRGLFGLSFLNLVFARADIFVLAKLYSPAILGLYTMAIYLVQTPTNFIMNMLGQTLMPAFSQIQGDNTRINRVLVQVSWLIVMLGLPAVAFILFCGRSLLTLTFGPRYGAMAGALMLASCVALVNLLNGQITTVFYSSGLPQLHRRAVAIMAITMVITIYPLSKWLGPAGGQVAAFSAVTIGCIDQIMRVRHITGLSLARYTSGLRLPVLLSLIVVVISVAAQPFAMLARPVANVALGILGCLVAYSLAGAILLRGQRTLAQEGLSTES